MKIAVIGANGQLGTELCKVIPKSDLIPLNQPDIEITDIQSVKTALYHHKPDVIINTAALVRVDDCEEEVETAYRVNALGAANVAVVADKMDAKLVHLSTDYVFGGDEGRKTPYTELDKPEPINVYGKSKLASEEYVQQLCHKYFIVRTSGLFGKAGSEGKGGNFVETILRLASEKSEIRVVNDQVFSPAYAVDLAQKILELCKTENYGIYHITNSGSCSWYEFAVEIVKIAGLKASVIPITSEEYPQKAKRPNYSVLGNEKMDLLIKKAMPTWQSGLKSYLGMMQ